MEAGAQQARRNTVIETAIRNGDVTLLGVMQSEFVQDGQIHESLSENTPLVLESNTAIYGRLQVYFVLLYYFSALFLHYCCGGDGNNIYFVRRVY